MNVVPGRMAADTTTGVGAVLARAAEATAQQRREKSRVFMGFLWVQGMVR